MALYYENNNFLLKAIQNITTANIGKYNPIKYLYIKIQFFNPIVYIQNNTNKNSFRKTQKTEICCVFFINMIFFFLKNHFWHVFWNSNWKINNNNISNNKKTMSPQEFNASLVQLKEGLEYYAYSLTNNRDDAQDLVQDTFLKALIYRDKFEDNTNLKAWTYTIMRNTFINNYRRAIKSGTIIDKTEDAYYLNSSSKSMVGMPESELSVKELEHAISTVPDDQRIPFEMQYKGYKYKEIAEELNLSIGTVKSRIFFCRKKLINKLKEYSD